MYCFGTIVWRRGWAVQELQGGDPLQIGPYRLVGRLGAGGMGKVYLGRSAGGRLVAVKVIREELAGDADFRARFRREVVGARRVSGLFTAPVVNADPDGPVPWLATAYVAGPSLYDAVSGRGLLPAASVRALAAALAEGLEAIHAVGVIHRDLKPSNVLLAADGPRIIDFGIARAAEATTLTHTGLVMGSPGFMSPEQAEGREVGPASDVFSLGAVLTFAATGDGPFGGGSTAALIYRIVFAAPDLAKVPAQIRGVVERCLAKDAEQRPTPAGLLDELGGADLTPDWLPAAITRGFPAVPAQALAGNATVTSARLDQQPDPPPAASALKSEPTTRKPQAPVEAVGSLLARLEHESAVKVTLFSPDGAHMATVSGKIARLWNTAPEEVARLRHQYEIEGATFSPDGTRIATRTSGPTLGSRQSVTLWDVVAGNQVAQLPHRRIVGFARFSPDGTRIATASEREKVVRLWDPSTGRETAQLLHGSSIDKVAFSPDSNRIIVLGYGGTLSIGERKPSLWDAVTGQEVARIQHVHPVLNVAFSPDGTRLVSFSADGTARLWDTASGREKLWGTRTRLWDAATGRERPWAERMEHWTAAFSPDSTCLATAGTDHVVRMWDTASGQEMAVMPHDNKVTMVIFSPDGARLATASADHVVRMWDTASGQEMARMPHDNTITMFTFGLEGTRLATASADHMVRIWDTASGKEKARMPHGRIRVFSPDRTQLATAGGGPTAQLLDTATGTELARMQHDGVIEDMLFNPDGSKLATRVGKTAYLWAT
jgi:WD40 repeat protein